ncbi:MAG: hypothetical protein ACHQ3P_01000 [Candidatus Limnocylindrales bacterium]
MSEPQSKHGEPPRKTAVRNAGAFAGGGAGGFQSIPVPMSTLSDEYNDEPAEPEDSDRMPDPEPPGVVQRILDRLTRSRNP